MTEQRARATEDWVEMKLRGLIVDPNTEAPVVVLREEGGSLYLPIWIGVLRPTRSRSRSRGSRPAAR